MVEENEESRNTSEREGRTRKQTNQKNEKQ